MKSLKVPFFHPSCRVLWASVYSLLWASVYSLLWASVYSLLWASVYSVLWASVYSVLWASVYDNVVIPIGEFFFKVSFSVKSLSIKKIFGFENQRTRVSSRYNCKIMQYYDNIKTNIILIWCLLQIMMRNKTIFVIPPRPSIEYLKNVSYESNYPMWSAS